MDQARSEYLLTQVVVLGVGGSLLAAAGLWLERRFGRHYGWTWSALAAIGLALAAIVAWGLGWPLASYWPAAVLAGFCLAVQAVSLRGARRWVFRLAEPRVVWAVMLAVCPVVAYLLSLGAHRPDSDLPEVYECADTTIHRLADLQAFTDRGREILLYAYDGGDSLLEAEQMLLAEEHLKNQVIRLASPDQACNCHGWVFTGGRAGVASSQVDALLADNGYVEVLSPQDGDLIIYRNDLGQVLHTGLVRHAGADGLVLVESKWGPLGVYIHPPVAQPWGPQFTFYRSPRQGHLLRMTGDVLTAGSPPVAAYVK